MNTVTKVCITTSSSTFMLDTPYGEVECGVVANCNTYYDGIGAYEYWGHKCYDKGNFCFEFEIEDIEIFNITHNDIFINYDAVKHLHVYSYVKKMLDNGELEIEIEETDIDDRE